MKEKQGFFFFFFVNQYPLKQYGDEVKDQIWTMLKQEGNYEVTNLFTSDKKTESHFRHTHSLNVYSSIGGNYLCERNGILHKCC